MVASLLVQPDSTSLFVGQTVQLAASVRDANNAVLAGHTVIWSTPDPAIAEVSSSGFVNAVGPGRVLITAATGSVSATAVVRVALAPVASVTVTPGSADLLVGGTAQLTATPRDANGVPLTGRVVARSSDDLAVATVSGTGLVEGEAEGQATITATSEGVSGTAAPFP